MHGNNRPLCIGLLLLREIFILNGLFLDIDTIMLYEDAGIYPMRGQSCNEFYRECEYFGICTLATESIVSELNEEDTAIIQNRIDNDFQITLTLNDLITAQLTKE